ncbi:hypothetical protein CV102_21835 [Natronococcus pandeyae]|uniref:Uncharacterized protein n=1 Tax=Natronococcus pandeyae TaxID=2055836 RepID=A0A8J8PXV3_9EURY|nr:hypothetical protein CV102_21835 [Natronococcus pandeyae]
MWCELLANEVAGTIDFFGSEVRSSVRHCLYSVVELVPVTQPMDGPARREFAGHEPGERRVRSTIDRVRRSDDRAVRRAGRPRGRPGWEG